MPRCAERRIRAATDARADRSWPIPSSHGSPGGTPRSRPRSPSTWSCRMRRCWAAARRRAMSAATVLSRRRWRAMVSGAAGDRRSRATLRRLYAHPRSGALVALESRARLFPRGLAAFIELRDQRCRTPYCDAPIRHRDHAQPWSEGGPTAAANGLGLCEQCNYTKESAGWQVTTGIDETHTHIASFATPTGRTYRSAAPPRAPTITISDVEVRVGITLARHAA